MLILRATLDVSSLLPIQLDGTTQRFQQLNGQGTAFIARFLFMRIQSRTTFDGLICYFTTTPQTGLILPPMRYDHLQNPHLLITPSISSQVYSMSDWQYSTMAYMRHGILR